jgi:hypothetical protein
MPIKIDEALGRLHRASCIVRYVAETEIDNDKVEIGETLKAVEDLILSAMRGLKRETP